MGGSLPNQSTCALWIWRRHSTVSLVVFCGECSFEYGVRGPLLRAVRSLYDQSRSLVRIAGSKSDLFPVHVGLRQGCPLSPVLFIIFMDRISRRSQGPEGVQDLQHVLERFAAECEAAGMRISTSKSEAMVLRPEKGGVPSPAGFGHSGGARSRAAAPSHIERSQLRWLGHLFRMPPGRLPREVSQACPTGRRPRGRPRTRWRDYVSRLAWERLSGSPGRAGGSVWGEGGLGISAQTAASMTRIPDQADENGWMDGWMDNYWAVLQLSG
ncbi:hypothetical protein L3Q82_010444 [Scortum barcoo]|uniref:Uncharacterized protein n=1 Tax=Scortum barcoo TaxID=214431 RepID=A0ACB8WC36_9TELE|nr:hypothetical protein L3Q82_010444 [Scortum barcoo]